MSATVTTSVTELPDSRVRVEAEVVPAEVERRVEQAARELGRQMKIAGFRKGKVPPQVVIRRLGRQAVLDEAVHDSITRWYLDAIEAAGIVPVGDPKLDVGRPAAAGEPLPFTIEIGVRPRAKLGRYKGLEVGRREPGPGEEVIDAELERMRSASSTLETVERPAELGDHVVIDYVGRIDGQPFEGGEGRDQLLELGSGRLLEGFEEQLVGAAAGDQRAVEVTFPDEYEERLAGRHASFEVTVAEVKAKRLPELDDEFAEQAAGFETLAELRADIAERARELEQREIEREFERAVLDAAVAEAQIELPESLIHDRAHELVEDTFAALERRGVSKASYLQIAGMDEEQLVNEVQEEAARGLRRESVLAAVIEAEGIEPSDEELLGAIAEAERPGDKPPEKLLEQLRSSGRIERARHDLAARQALELLVREATPISVEQAKARDKLWTPGKDDDSERPGKLWTPGSSRA